MSGIVAALVLAYLVWLTPQAWQRVDRYLALLERRGTPAPDPEPVEDPMPADLLLHARGEYDQEWARDQAVEHLLEARARLGSWDNVRIMVGQGGA